MGKGRTFPWRLGRGQAGYTGENRISSSAAGCREELGSNTGEGEGAQTQNKSGRDPQLGGSLRGQWLSQVPPLLELEGTLPCGTEAHPDSSARWSCSLALATLCEQAAPVKASSRPSGSGDVANKAGDPVSAPLPHIGSTIVSGGYGEHSLSIHWQEKS